MSQVRASRRNAMRKATLANANRRRALMRSSPWNRASARGSRAPRPTNSAHGGETGTLFSSYTVKDIVNTRDYPTTVGHSGAAPFSPRAKHALRSIE